MAGLANTMVCGVVRAQSYEHAKRFYTEVLGLNLAQELPGGGLFAAAEKTMVMVYEHPGLPAPENTVLSFGVSAEGFDAVVAELRSKGVVLEDYEVPETGLRTVDGVADMNGRKSAWFKDSEGNILNIIVM